MGSSVICILVVLDVFAFNFFVFRYLKKETVKDAIGWAVTSAVMCILYMIRLCNEYDVIYVFIFCIYLINFGLAIYSVVREMKKKK